MIASFKDKETKALFEGKRSRALPQSLQRGALKKLTQLEAADRMDDLKVPSGNRVEQLRGDREGQHSIRINDQWRVCFRWERGETSDVEIVDYHP